MDQPYIVYVYRDCDVYEYRYDSLDEAKARQARETNPTELIVPENQ